MLAIVTTWNAFILPLVVLRRLDCVLEPTKGAVLEAYERHRRHLDDGDAGM